MCLKHAEVDMGFTNNKFPPGTHMCMIFQDEKERRRIIGKFLGSGILNNYKVGYFADVMTKDEVLSWLKDMDIDIPSTTSTDNFTVQSAVSAYCPDGSFVVEEMLERLKAFHDDAVQKGFCHGRVSGEMSWVLKNLPGSERVMEYEARVNVLLQTHPISAICQYDANRFSGALIMDVLRTHPMMIASGEIVRNPYYLSPEDVLAEMKTRLERSVV